MNGIAARYSKIELTTDMIGVCLYSMCRTQFFFLRVFCFFNLACSSGISSVPVGTEDAKKAAPALGTSDTIRKICRWLYCALFLLLSVVCFLIYLAQSTW